MVIGSTYLVTEVTMKPKSEKPEEENRGSNGHLEAEATAFMLKPKAKMYTLDSLDDFKGQLIDIIA